MSHFWKMQNSDLPDSELDEDLGTTTLTRPPSMYKVILLNDDYSPMDFVVMILKRFFNKSEEESNKIMLEVHQKGAGLAGIYTHEIAETKVLQVHQYAKQHQYPLKCTVEEA